MLALKTKTEATTTTFPILDHNACGENDKINLENGLSHFWRKFAIEVKIISNKGT